MGDALFLKQDVIELQVAVADVVVVGIRDGADYLVEDYSSLVLSR